jgi:uncharacterized protein (DUF2141 family)
MKIPFLMCLTLFSLGSSLQTEVHKLHIIVTGAKESGKTVYVAVFRPEDNFPKEEGAWKHGQFVSGAGEGVLDMELSYGDYAIAVYLDENGNGKLDKNVIGYPREQFGFSNNFRPKTGAPRFKNCRFVFSETNATVTIRLSK